MSQGKHENLFWPLMLALSIIIIANTQIGHEFNTFATGPLFQTAVGALCGGGAAYLVQLTIENSREKDRKINECYIAATTLSIQYNDLIQSAKTLCALILRSEYAKIQPLDQSFIKKENLSFILRTHPANFNILLENGNMYKSMTLLVEVINTDFDTKNGLAYKINTETFLLKLKDSMELIFQSLSAIQTYAATLSKVVPGLERDEQFELKTAVLVAKALNKLEKELHPSPQA